MGVCLNVSNVEVVGNAVSVESFAVINVEIIYTCIWKRFLVNSVQTFAEMVIRDLLKTLENLIYQ